MFAHSRNSPVPNSWRHNPWTASAWSSWLRVLLVAMAVLALLLMAARTAAAQSKTVPPMTEPIPVDEASAFVSLFAPTQLPAAPAAPAEVFADVPELFLQERAGKNFLPGQWQQFMSDQAFVIHKLDQQQLDGFWKTLQAQRSDLAGLNVLMGDACRMPLEPAKRFKLSVDTLRLSMSFLAAPKVPPTGATVAQAAFFWDIYKMRAKQLASALGKQDSKVSAADIARAEISALMQILAPESPPVRIGLAQYFKAMPSPEATTALARLAVFSMHKEVSDAAIAALEGRPKPEYMKVLLVGLRYPWPTVVSNSLHAIQQLKCKELVPALVDLFGEPDPRLPVAAAGKFQVNQVVKVNHHRNCLLCHGSADKTTPAHVIVAPIPDPGKPLPSAAVQYYQPKLYQNTDLLVRADMTYLRQDFSLMEPVANAAPWPAIQRFDFLVRTVPLTPDQAKVFQAKLQPKAGALSQYHEALQAALQELTGLNPAPTPQAWKQALNLAG